jgi:hypothetical protein
MTAIVDLLLDVVHLQQTKRASMPLMHIRAAYIQEHWVCAEAAVQLDIRSKVTITCAHDIIES